MHPHAKITLSTLKAFVKDFVYKLYTCAWTSILTHLAEVMQLHGENHPGETGFLICKSKITIVKNIPLSQGGIVLHVSRNVFLAEKTF